MPAPMILVAESTRFSPQAAALLRTAGSVQLANLDRRSLLRQTRRADALWVRLRHRIDREVLEAAPRLRYIASATTGLNHIDVEQAHARGIRVVSLRGEGEFLRQIHATAEHTLALMLSLVRSLPAAAAHVCEGGWNRDLFVGREIHGKTIGVVGYGRVGRMVADLACALGARVLANDVAHAVDPFSRVQHRSLADLLAQSDIVSLHVNLEGRSQGFWGRHEFQQMKRGSFFVNTARGELIEESALLEALESGHLAGAALDVLSGEDSTGMESHPLVRYCRRHSNLIVTPHIGGCTTESMERTELFLAEKLVAYLCEGIPGEPVTSGSRAY